MGQEPDVVSLDVPAYCRDIETYLCRKNEGHLIRIVGPAFDQVCGWAMRGVPLKIAYRGIDRYCERYYAKGGRRRPVRIEFCEADILDAFDEWRRAVGVTAASSAGADAGDSAGAAAGRRPALAAHLERAIARLRSPAGFARSAEFHARVDTVIRELESCMEPARGARGEARTRLIERLAALDTELQAAAARELDPARARELRQEAEAELAPFAARMPPETRERATQAAIQRLVREALGLPVLTYE